MNVSTCDDLAALSGVDAVVDRLFVAPYTSNVLNSLADADVVSIHAPLTDETKGLLDAESFALMKPTAHIVNVARGELLVEDDLLAALDSGEISGAGLDVFADEPADHDAPATFDNPLCKRDDVLATPPCRVVLR